MKELFDLPLEIKARNLDSAFSKGYIPKYPGTSLLEGQDIDGAEKLKACEKFTALMWPSGNARFWYTLFSPLFFFGFYRRFILFSKFCKWTTCVIYAHDIDLTLYNLMHFGHSPVLGFICLRLPIFIRVRRLCVFSLFGNKEFFFFGVMFQLGYQLIL